GYEIKFEKPGGLSDLAFRNFVKDEEDEDNNCPNCKDELEWTPIYDGEEPKEKLPELPKIASTEEWKSQLSEKYRNLIKVANDNLPGLWDSLEFELSVHKILNIADCTLPFAGIVLGPPSSLKTVGIDLFRHWINVYYTDSFSAKSFVSHSTAIRRGD